MDIKVDRTQLLALAGNDPSILRPIVEQFHENSLSMVEEMKDYLTRADFEQIASGIHQLKGSSGTLGMVSLYQSCVDLEARLGDVLDENLLNGLLFAQLAEQVSGSTQSVLALLDRPETTAG